MAASFAFPSQPGTDRDQVRAHCRIDDLQDFVNDMQAKEQRKGNLLKSRMESQGRDQQNDGYFKP
jgi:hypothetical protein